MSKNRFFVKFGCLWAGLLLSGPVFAQDGSQLFVEGVDIDYSNANLFISGAHFNNGSAPVVTLAGTEIPVTAVSSDGKGLTVTLSSSFANFVGSYLLTVSTGAAATQKDVFALTLGAAGPQGPKGEDGAAGATGLASLTKTTPVAAGSNCAAGGVKVETGIDGNRNALLEAWEVNAAMTRYVCDGVQGPQGLKGDTGPVGPQGLKGDKGDTGPMGPQGLKGDTGLVGPQGLKGDKGDTGPMGPQGLKGDKGNTGDRGLQGLTGPQGPKGDTGAQGWTGPVGPQGPMGPSGKPFSLVCHTVEGPEVTSRAFASGSYATCPAGWLLTGGACRHSAGTVVGTGSLITGNSYACVLTGPSSGAGSVHALGKCCAAQ
ncbi:DUF7151 family protein [Stigmatella ashevillensis]|uniref:DUF7151 family protein n=1 Tax=Stigmatella ashevillensis TaxID=2995309 RepID=UPI004032F66C